MAKKYPSDDQEQYMVRFPAGMRDRIKDNASANGRSMNAEIIKRLQDTLDYEDQSAFFRDAPIPDENAYGAIGDHLRATPGIAIKGTLDRLFDEVRSLRMSILDVRHYPDGRHEVEFAPSAGSAGDTPLPDPAPFPKPAEPGYDEALLRQVETIAAQYGFDLVKKNSG